MAPTLTYFQHLSALLDLEAEAERQELARSLQMRTPEEAEASGSSLVHLVVRSEEAGLGGRFLLTLGKRSLSEPLPWTRLGAGTPVLLSEETPHGQANGSWRGVVSASGRDTLQVALLTAPETGDERPYYRLDLSTDEISRQRQKAALERLDSARGGRLVDLREVLLGRSAPCFEGQASFIPLDSSLNASQVEAVRFALSAEDIAIIHGPPGTGKTTTVVELIRQLVRRGQTVLACAPSNLGVDNMLEKLLAAGENALRLGHPARVLPALREHTLDLMVENHPDVRLAHKLARQAHTLREQSFKTTRGRTDHEERQAMRQEARQMLDEARRIEDQVIERLLGSASVLCATLTGLDGGLLGDRRFDWCVTDEASQATQPSAWIPVLRSNRLVLAGDPFQLPPTVVSKEAAAQGLAASLMERLMDQPEAQVSRRLTLQYRMHQDIMQFSSQQFYAGSLEASPGVRLHLLSDLPGLAAGELTGTPVDFIDTAGASYDEELDPDGESRFNPLEADLAIRRVQSLLAAGLPAGDIALITPYSAQVRLLRSRLDLPELEINSVDGFQGREKEAVVISLVRSNPQGEIGFLGDVRRMNVALTRARRKLIVIGDSATITAHPFYQAMLSYFESIGAYHSVWEES